jgi:hypothetical protein
MFKHLKYSNVKMFIILKKQKKHKNEKMERKPIEARTYNRKPKKKNLKNTKILNWKKKVEPWHGPCPHAR